MCADLLLCDPAHGVLEAPSTIIPGQPSAPPDAPPPLHGACDGLMDPLQLVLTDLQPAHSKDQAPSTLRVKRGWLRAAPSSRPDDVFIGLALLPQVHGQALQLLDGFFSHHHVALRVAGGPALRDENAGGGRLHRQRHAGVRRADDDDKIRA